MFEKRKVTASLILNALIVLTTIGVVISYFFGNDGKYHIPPSFRFCLFTTDSNLLCMLTSAIMCFFEIRFLRSGKPIPDLALILKFVGTTAVALTFTIVITFLGPLMGFMEMVFGGTSIYMHFFGPIFAFVSFCFFETKCILSKKMLIPAVVPALIYGVIYLIMVVLVGADNGGWIDFYSFNMNGMWHISFSGIMLLTLLLAAVTRLLHNHIIRKN